MLIDTSGLLCIMNSAEPDHGLACELLEASTVRLLHSYVIAELVPLAHVRRIRRFETIQFVASLVDDPSIEIVWVDKELHSEAVELLQARRDKTYSLCDAVSFVLMRRYKIHEALTADRHFEQEGFRRLLS
jgi:predicted nucleic acid-binding protein